MADVQDANHVSNSLELPDVLKGIVLDYLFSFDYEKFVFTRVIETLNKAFSEPDFKRSTHLPSRIFMVRRDDYRKDCGLCLRCYRHKDKCGILLCRHPRVERVFKTSSTSHPVVKIKKVKLWV